MYHGPASFSRWKVPAVATCWLLALLATVIWIHSSTRGWDLDVYGNAVRAVRAGQDPYATGIQRQLIFQQHFEQHPHAHRPMTYVYSPITLPALRLIGHLPLWWVAAGFWTLYAGAIVAQLWACWTFTRGRERSVFLFLAALLPFFPGLLTEDVLFSGNIAYIFYGMVFLAAVYGWRSGRWWPFYAAVLVVSCGKAPLLCLLVIPAFSARRQWVLSIATGAAGVLLFAIQPLLWPTLFRHFLEAVELQFSLNQDFGVSPSCIAGWLATLHGHSYQTASLLAYAITSAVILGAMLHFSREYFRGHLALAQWAPLLLIGAVLLNPRVKEYDVAAIALPMALVLWRFAARMPVWTRISVVAGLVAANLVTQNVGGSWRPTEMFVVVACFAAGSVDLQLVISAAYGRQPRTVSIPVRQSLAG